MQIPLFSEETFCFFSNVLSRKNVEMKFKLVAGALQQAEGQDVGGLLHLLHIHLCQPLHPPDDRYSRVSLATRMDLSVHPTKPGVYYLKKISSTSSYFDRIIPLYPPDDHFSRVSLATRIDQTQKSGSSRQHLKAPHISEWKWNSLFVRALYWSRVDYCQCTLSPVLTELSLLYLLRQQQLIRSTVQPNIRRVIQRRISWAPLSIFIPGPPPTTLNSQDRVMYWWN